MTHYVVGRGAMGLFLLRYGNHFPYTSLLIQSLRASHYISLDRNIQDLRVFVEEVRREVSSRTGRDLTPYDIVLLLRSVERHHVTDVVLESVTAERLEHVFSTIYVTLTTCLAAGLSENAAKFGLGLNVSTTVTQSLLRIINPMIPTSQPLMKFLCRAVCASVGILTAFRLEKSLLIWANCLFGAELIISAVEHLISPRAIKDKDESESKNFRTTLLWTIAGTGLCLQMLPGQSDMPFLVKGVLIGPRLVEYGLQALSLSLKDPMSLLRVSSLRRSPSCVAHIILNSNRVPFGRITDEFDREISNFFKDTESVSTMVSSMLKQSENFHPKYKFPTKVRDQICVAISSLLPNLSDSEFLAIPSLLERFPSLMLSTTKEDELFEDWMRHLSTRIDRLDKDQISSLIRSIQNVRLIHQCKNEPIFRFFENLKTPKSSQTKMRILTSVGNILGPQKLNLIRHHLVNLVVSIPPSERTATELLVACIRLPVFPESKTHIAECFRLCPIDENSVLANLFIPDLPCIDSDELNRVHDLKSALERILEYPRSLLRDHTKAQIFLQAIPNTALTEKQLAGYMRLLAVLSEDDTLSVPIDQISKLSDKTIVCDVLGSLILTNDAVEIVAKLSSSLPSTLRRCDVERMISPNSQISEQYIKLFEESIVPRVAELEAAALLVYHMQTSTVAQSTLASLIEGSSINELIEAEKIVSSNGMIYMDGSVSDSLKRITRTLFRRVRMAPIDNVR